jgi:hypothetical protein
LRGEVVWVECRLGSLSSRSVGERFVLVESGLGSVSSRSVEERRRGGLLQVSSLSLVSSRRLFGDPWTLMMLRLRGAPLFM